MFKTLFKIVSAPVAIAAVLLVGTEPGRKITRKVIKETVKVGAAVADTCKQLFDETEEHGTKLIGQAKDSTSDLLGKAKDKTNNLIDRVKESTQEIVAEAKAELKAAKGNGQKSET